MNQCFVRYDREGPVFVNLEMGRISRTETRRVLFGLGRSEDVAVASISVMVGAEDKILRMSVVIGPVDAQRYGGSIEPMSYDLPGDLTYATINGSVHAATLTVVAIESQRRAMLKLESQIPDVELFGQLTVEVALRSQEFPDAEKRIEHLSTDCRNLILDTASDTDFVYNAYAIVFGRNADSAGLLSNLSFLRSREATRMDVVEAFLNSQEWTTRNPGVAPMAVVQRMRTKLADETLSVPDLSDALLWLPGQIRREVERARGDMMRFLCIAAERRAQLSSRSRGRLHRFFTSTSRSTIAGHVDQLVDGQVIGWIWNRAKPDENVIVQAVLDKSVVATCIASEYRPDLELLGYGSGRYGFRLNILSNKVFLDGDGLLTLKVEVQGRNSIVLAIFELPRNDITATILGIR